MLLYRSNFSIGETTPIRVYDNIDTVIFLGMIDPLSDDTYQVEGVLG